MAKGIGTVQNVHDRVEFNNGVQILSGTGAPSVSTGTGAAVGTLYISTAGTGQVYIKTSKKNSAWVKLATSYPAS